MASKKRWGVPVGNCLNCYLVDGHEGPHQRTASPTLPAPMSWASVVTMAKFGKKQGKLNMIVELDAILEADAMLKAREADSE